MTGGMVRDVESEGGCWRLDIGNPPSLPLNTCVSTQIYVWTRVSVRRRSEVAVAGGEGEGWSSEPRKIQSLKRFEVSYHWHAPS